MKKQKITPLEPALNWMSYLRIQKNIFFISSAERFLCCQQVCNTQLKEKKNPKPYKFEFTQNVAIQNARSTPIQNLKSILYASISVFVKLLHSNSIAANNHMCHTHIFILRFYSFFLFVFLFLIASKLSCWSFEDYSKALKD